MSNQMTEGQSVISQGRIVWVMGDLWKGKVKLDDNTKQPVIDQRTGQPTIQYGFGLAVPKNDPSVQQLINAIQTQARALYPSGQFPPDFAWKMKDGDGLDHNGQPFSQRQGYAGCWVFELRTMFPIKFFRFENGANTQVPDGIKCGDYVNVQISVVAHPPKGRGKAGMYLNPMAVQLAGYGEPIVNTPSADSIFGTQAPAIPHGASAMPQTGAFPMQGSPSTPFGQPSNGYPPTGMVAPGAPPHAYIPPVPSSTPPSPHYGVLPPTQQNPAQTAPSFGAGPTSANAMPGVPGMGVPGGMMPQQPQNGYPPSTAAPTPGYPPNGGVPQMPGILGAQGAPAMQGGVPGNMVQPQVPGAYPGMPNGVSFPTYQQPGQ